MKNYAIKVECKCPSTKSSSKVNFKFLHRSLFVVERPIIVLLPQTPHYAYRDHLPHRFNLLDTSQIYPAGQSRYHSLRHNPSQLSQELHSTTFSLPHSAVRDGSQIHPPSCTCNTNGQ
ncbi:hypothetical protein I3760_09G124600 [Carya illinoinensis]|nr:hypothetical protein I3760_09G124600 [Carya illinoinensis]